LQGYFNGRREKREITKNNVLSLIISDILVIEKMNTDNELIKTINDIDKKTRYGRLERLRFLLSQEYSEPTPVNALANEYYEEARLCWYVGAFVATIIMTQLCFEELLRSHYRVCRGVSGYLKKQIKVDNASFKELIDQAHDDAILDQDEFNALNKIRKDFRNPYVHVKDFGIDNDFSKPNFMKQYLKIHAPDIVGSGVEDEAKEAISILSSKFLKISRRLGGI
jgi:hypothetical protein